MGEIFSDFTSGQKNYVTACLSHVNSSGNQAICAIIIPLVVPL